MVALGSYGGQDSATGRRSLGIALHEQIFIPGRLCRGRAGFLTPRLVQSESHGTGGIQKHCPRRDAPIASVVHTLGTKASILNPRT